jgi:hypothetical protein
MADTERPVLMISLLLPAALSAVLAAAVPTWLYLKLWADFRVFTLNCAPVKQLSASTDIFDKRLLALENRLANLDRSKDEHAEWISQAESLNLNRRGQVLRLHRRGESVPDIASALHLRPGEVSLMIKVYEIGRDSSDSDQKNI